MTRHSSRRGFLKQTALTGVGFWVAAGTAPAASRSPNEKLNIGIIGAGGRGASNTGSVQSENIAALCDVNEERLAAAAKKFPQAKTFNDWRKLVDHKGLDAVVVSTTDHTHAPASVWAMRRGLSVYCEKPIAHSVYEASVVRKTYLANKDKIATQQGTQIHAGDNYRRVVELVQGGAIGPVRECHVWCSRVGPCPERPKDTPEVPKHINWDLWLGPAPQRPFHPSYMGGCTVWEQRWDFGNGCLGDMGSHLIDLAYWALKLQHPLTAEGEGDVKSEESYPHWLKCRWEHPARGDMPPVKLCWYDGIQRPESPPGHDLQKWGIGLLFKGENGMILCDYGKRILLPEDKFKDFKAPEPTIPKSLGHHQEWIHGCKTGAPTLCNFDYAGLLIMNNLLGSVAFRVGKKLQWDPEKLQAVNCPEADRFINRQYREGWTLEG